MRRLTLLVVIGALVAVTAAGSGCSGPSAGSGGSSGSGATDGATLVNERCTRCHSIERIQSASKSAEAWDATVTRMRGKGAQLSDAEKQTVVDYLAKTYGQ